MFLKHLLITNKDGLIRRIDFHPGMNLIVDDTEKGTEMTGNNVGKTTTLRLIDYCLGADARPIYTSTDGAQNRKVKTFLEETEVTLELCMVSSFVDMDAYKVTVRRNFTKKRGKALNQVDGRKYAKENFCEALQEAMWGEKTSNPDFRQIISHSLRIDLMKHERPLSTEGNQGDAFYETLYIYLFGLNDVSCEDKLDLRKQISKELAFKKQLEKDSSSLSKLKSQLRAVERKISELNEKKEALNVNPDFEADLEERVRIKSVLAQLGMQQNDLELRQQLVQEAVDEMSKTDVKASANEVKMIYQQAGAFGAELHHTFEELLSFHNDMMVEKIDFIKSELPELDDKIGRCYNEINRVRNEEQALEKKLKLSVSFDTYEQINTDLLQQTQEKGKLEARIEQIENVDGAIQEKEQKLKQIDDLLFSTEYEQKVDDRLDKFNDYFSAVSQRMYAKDYTIEQEKVKSKDNKPCYKFSIADNGNYSVGVKKGEATCFDLAYVRFADEMGISCLHFILNDKEELLDENQFVKIAGIVEGQKNVQYVSSILRSKLPNNIEVNRYEVLSLSEDDKLFRI